MNQQPDHESHRPEPNLMTQLAIRVSEDDRARVLAIVKHGDASNTSGAIRFALALTERHYQENGLVAQFAEASREWRDSGDGDAWQASESDTP